MASAAELAIILLGKDQASSVIAGASGKMKASFNLVQAAAGAMAGFTTGALSDMARAGAEDAASAETMRKAWENASNQLEDTSKKLEDNKFISSELSKELAVLGSNYQRLGTRQDEIKASMATVDGSTAAGKAQFASLAAELSRVEKEMGTNNAKYKEMNAELQKANSAIGIQTGQVASMRDSWGAAGSRLDEFITKMRDTAAIDDSEMKPALSSLIAITGDYSKSMELAALAADIARGRTIDLASAAQLVGKVAQGNTAALKKFGITLDENATASEALAELQKRFAGQAEAYGNTSAGAMKKVGLQIDDFKESLGQSLGPATEVIGLLPGMTAGFTAVSAGVGGLLPALTRLRATLLTAVIPAIASTVLALGPILIPIAAITLAVGLLYLAWDSNFLGIRDVTDKVIKAVEPLLKGLEKIAVGVFKAIGEGIKNYVNVWIAAINVFISGINALINAAKSIGVLSPEFGTISPIAPFGSSSGVQPSGQSPSNTSAMASASSAQPHIQIMIGERAISDFVVRVIDERSRGASFIGPSAGPAYAISRSY